MQLQTCKFPPFPASSGKEEGKGAVVSVLPPIGWFPLVSLSPYWSRFHWSLSWLLRPQAKLVCLCHGPQADYQSQKISVNKEFEAGPGGPPKTQPD